MEVADGFLQRETQLLLGSEEFRSRVRGVVVAAACSGSALCAAESIKSAGFEVWAVSGLLTNSPLFMQEFASRSPIPVVSSRSEREWADIIMPKVTEQKEEYRWAAVARADY